MRFLAAMWLGLVLGVSFLATPIKFQAESLTLPVALDVGRTTFHAFGKLEWLLSLALVVVAWRSATAGSLGSLAWVLVAIVIALVAVQTRLLIPRLDLRVAAIIAGEVPPPSHLHKVYAGSEAVKAVVLLLLATVAGRQGG